MKYIETTVLTPKYEISWISNGSGLVSGLRIRKDALDPFWLEGPFLEEDLARLQAQPGAFDRKVGILLMLS